MIPGVEEFLRLFRWGLWQTAARPLVELRRALPSLEHVAESVRLAAAEAAPLDFWGYFSTAEGRQEVQRALQVLREGVWPVARGNPTQLALDVCAVLRA